MNKEWSELNKTMQAQIKKKDTYKMGIDTLFNFAKTVNANFGIFQRRFMQRRF